MLTRTTTAGNESPAMFSILKGAVGKYDLAGWSLVAVFFTSSAIINGKPVVPALGGAIGIIGLMLVVGLAVEVLIETIKHFRGLGTITGLLTNGPEALIVLIGLIHGDILFANSTPLGSNFVNPVVLVIATLLLGSFTVTLRIHLGYFLLSLFVTAIMAGSFFYLPEKQYPVWIGVVLTLSLLLFYNRPKEEDGESEPEDQIPRLWFLPALVTLTGAGYLLDPVVSFTSEASAASKDLIGFTVLSFLSSWPEFKTIFALVSRQKYSAGILNTITSNIINLWLAVGGLTVYLILA